VVEASDVHARFVGEGWTAAAGKPGLEFTPADKSLKEARASAPEVIFAPFRLCRSS